MFTVVELYKTKLLFVKSRQHSGIIQALRQVIYKLVENPEYVQVHTASKFRNKHRNVGAKGLHSS